MTYVFSLPPSYSVITSCLGIVDPFTRLLWPISCHVRVCVLVLHEAVSHIKVAWLGSCHKWWEWDITTASWRKPTHSSLLRGALIWLRFLLCRPPEERTLLQASIKPFLIMGWRGRRMGPPLLFDHSWHAPIKCAIHPCSLSLSHYGGNLGWVLMHGVPRKAGEIDLMDLYDSCTHRLKVAFFSSLPLPPSSVLLWGTKGWWSL